MQTKLTGGMIRVLDRLEGEGKGHEDLIGAIRGIYGFTAREADLIVARWENIPSE